MHLPPTKLEKNSQLSENSSSSEVSTEVSATKPSSKELRECSTNRKMRPISITIEDSQLSNPLSPTSPYLTSNLKQAHSSFASKTFESLGDQQFVDRIKTAIKKNIDQCATIFQHKNNQSSLISELNEEFEKSSKLVSEKGKRIDDISEIEANMDLILLFFKSSKYTLQEMYKCDDVEIIFNSSQTVACFHQLIEKCGEEMSQYMNTLEAVKSSTNTKNPLKHSMFSSSKKHVPWSTKSSSNRLAKIADNIGCTIPEMRELYILSENILKRLDLAGEWYELHSVILSDLEREVKDLNDQLQSLKNQIPSSGLFSHNDTSLRNSTINSPVTELPYNVSARFDVTELEFLQQALCDLSSKSGKTLPYFNGAQKVVITK